MLYFKNGKTVYRRWIALLLICCMIVQPGMANAESKRESETAMPPVSAEEPEETSSPQPSQVPSPSPSGQPSQAPSPSPSEQPAVTPYQLLNKGAVLKKGGQKGIHYKKVKGKKVYQIKSFTTDTVSLKMSQPSRFRIYGGGSRKQVRKKYAAVSAKGVVRSRRHGRGESVCTIVEAVSKVTGEKRYIYIYFQEKLYSKSGKRISLYERYSGRLDFNYSFKRLDFTVSNPKKASVSRKGKVTGKKHGTVYVTAKVKGSVRNQIKIKVVIKILPWIVSSKNKMYDYKTMTADLHKLHARYPKKTYVFSIGKSEDNRNIWCIRIGKASASKSLFINAAIHAREWKNTQVVMRQTEDMLRLYYQYKKRFQKTCIYIVPMDNPDGVSIAQYGFSAIRNKKLQKLCRKIKKAKIWKANARGVDLNDNFPAGFHKSKKRKKPAYMAYSGKKAASEKETRALMKFVKKVMPQAVLNVHSTGSIIYWDFDVEEGLHSELYKLAYKVHSLNQYPMVPGDGNTRASGGFADWINYEMGIPSITIETGSVPCPLPHSQFGKIYKKNNKMFLWFMTKY